jgi:hypothetical protein
MVNEERIKSVLEHFYFPEDDSFFEPLISAVASSSAQMLALAQNFSNGLRAAVSVASVPFTMLKASFQQLSFQALHDRQRFLAFLDGSRPKEEQEQWAYESALEIASAQSKRSPEPDEVERAGLRFVDEFEKLFDSELRPCADELLRQCLVLAWGSFEVLASDLFVALLNIECSKTILLLNDPRTRRYYQPREFGTALEERKYNLSNCMGEVLIQQKRIDDVGTIRDVYDVLFPSNKELRSVLADSRLWQLAQDRNLIVHRRAIVDVRYVENTGSC